MADFRWLSEKPSYENPCDELYDWLGLIGLLLETELLEESQASQIGRPLESIRLRREASDCHLPILHLQHRLKLSDFTVFCAVLACASGFDPIYVRLFRKLTGKDKPSLGLALRLFSNIKPVKSKEIYKLSQPESPARLLFDLQGDERLEKLLLPGPLTAQVLEGELFSGSLLQGISLWQAEDEDASKRFFSKEQAAGISELISRVHLGSLRGFGVILSGSPGCGRRSALRAAAAEQGLPLIFVDVNIFKGKAEKDAQRLSRAVLLLSAATDGAAVLYELSAVFKPGEALCSLVEDCRRFCPLFFLISHEGIPALLPLEEDAVELCFPEDSILQRRNLWQELSEEYILEKGTDIHQFANKLRYTAGDIKKILHRACINSQSQGRKAINSTDIWAGVRLHNAGEISGQSLSRVSCVFTWDDIVLPEEPSSLMRSACDRIIHAHTVNDVWGFGKKLPYGRGLSILLYGPPGTGKTMSAQVIARELGIELYKVDLSQLVSKYIGETEKNVSEIFDFAYRTNCVLLFDEADSLFTRRTEVSDANDRHANTETAYLLQKIEEHRGVSILSTNLLSNMDTAFRRRFTYIIGIPKPDAALRLSIWNKVFPPEAPVRVQPGFERLAEKLEISASSIKTIALDAAYRAAAEDSPVNYEHIRQAVKVEMIKQGTRMTEAELNAL